MVQQPKSGLALGLVGHEGAVGIQFALGLDAGIFTLRVQTPGVAWRADGAALELLTRDRPSVLLALSRYLWSLSQEVAVFAALAQLSEVKPRLARWILTSYSRTHHRDLLLTQVHLAEMLGVRRASVTLAAIELKSDGLIRYSRGRLTVLDEAGLAAMAGASASGGA